MQDLKDRLQNFDRRVTQDEAVRDLRQKQLDDLMRETTQLEKDIDLLQRTEQVLLHLSTKLLGQSTKVIDRLVTLGLRITFDDQNLEFRTAIEKSRGKTAIKFQLLQDGREKPTLDAYGGGVLAMTGLLLRATTIIVLGLRRVLVLDETLSHVATQYIPNASRLMKKLCEDLGFTIFMVTHQPEFAASATLHYRAEQRAGGTTFIKV